MGTLLSSPQGDIFIESRHGHPPRLTLRPGAPSLPPKGLMSLLITAKRGTLIIVGIYILSVLTDIDLSASSIWNDLPAQDRIENCYVPIALGLLALACLVFSLRIAPVVTAALPTYYALMKLRDLFFEMSGDLHIYCSTIARALLWVLAALLAFHVIRSEQHSSSSTADRHTP